jgi:hypothetical protein
MSRGMNIGAHRLNVHAQLTTSDYSPGVNRQLSGDCTGFGHAANLIKLLEKGRVPQKSSAAGCPVRSGECVVVPELGYRFLNEFLSGWCAL